MTQHVATAAQHLEHEQASHSYVVKNTFINLHHQDDQETRVRGSSSRASSAPPGLRFAVKTMEVDETGRACSSASTSAAGDDEESVDDVQCEPALDAASLSAVDGTNHTSHGIQLDLLSLLPPAPRPALRSGAKAWRPAAAPALPPGVRDQFAAIVVATQAALEESIAVTRCEALETSDGWSLMVSVATANLGEYCDLEFALEEAVAPSKVAMLHAAEESEKVYVVGYEAMPFSPLPLQRGFAAQLAVVRDEASACWDVLQTGVCNRGCACRWQHPSWQAVVRISVELDSTQ